MLFIPSEFTGISQNLCRTLLTKVLVIYRLPFSLSSMGALAKWVSSPALKKKGMAHLLIAACNRIKSFQAPGDALAAGAQNSPSTYKPCIGQKFKDCFLKPKWSKIPQKAGDQATNRVSRNSSFKSVPH